VSMVCSSSSAWSLAAADVLVARFFAGAVVRAAGAFLGAAFTGATVAAALFTGAVVVGASFVVEEVFAGALVVRVAMDTPFGPHVWHADGIEFAAQVVFWTL
jgi:hypothetical protein